jgi:hypothetical protein
MLMTIQAPKRMEYIFNDGYVTYNLVIIGRKLFPGFVFSFIGNQYSYPVRLICSFLVDLNPLEYAVINALTNDLVLSRNIKNIFTLFCIKNYLNFMWNAFILA